ncbi:MAG: 30S ribosomal protein S6 [Candidatus Levybacteria bacterium]|nr:30S ribosomal protein S6 [Candidatus Levybacteria bacterium]
MRIYELALVLRNSLPEDKRKKIIDTIKSWAKELKAAKEESIGEKNFSYPIKKEKSGFYYVLSLEGDNISVDFEKRILMQDEVLRHLLVRIK